MSQSTGVYKTIACANAGIVLFYLFSILVVSLHFLRSELNPVRQFISEYAVGKYGFLMTAAFICLSLGSLLLLIAASAMLWQYRKAYILLLFLIWSACVFTAAIFPTDISGAAETAHGHIHNNASMLGFVCIIACAFFTNGLYKNNHQKQYYRLFLLLSLLMLVAFTAMLISVITGFAFTGLMQRLFICLVITWLILSGNSIKHFARSKASLLRRNDS